MPFSPRASRCTTALNRLTGFVFANDTDQHNWIVALLATLVIVLLAQPVKETVHNALDRMFYRDRYDYRRALVGFARDLNSDLDVVRLSQRLVSRIVETLVVDRMALMLADEPGRATTARSVISASHRGCRACREPRRSPRASMRDTPSRWTTRSRRPGSWRRRSSSGATRASIISCRASSGAAPSPLSRWGRKDMDEPFSSEDLALLTAVAGQVATAIENGRLYRQLQVKAEELGRMREFNENILESLDDGLVVFDVDERIVRWNRALENLYGVTGAEAIGRMLGEIFDAGFVEALRVARHEYPQGATLSRVPLKSREDGERVLVNATEVPLQRPPGDASALVGTILLIEDITERVRLEEQLQISEKMASIGLLAAGVAHEVNTPLTGISSFTQMLLEGADPDDPKTVLLEKIERQTFRAAKIVSGLLNLSRPGLGRQRARPGGRERGHYRCLFAARTPVRGRQDQGAARTGAGADVGCRHRASVAAGLPELVPQRTRCDAARRLAVGDHAD